MISFVFLLLASLFVIMSLASVSVTALTSVVWVATVLNGEKEIRTDSGHLSTDAFLLGCVQLGVRSMVLVLLAYCFYSLAFIF